MKIFRESLAAFGVLFTIGTTALRYSQLPQRIPTHFGASGVADGWGDRSSIWVLVAVTCILYGMLTAVRFLPQRLFNIPVEEEQRVAAMPLAFAMIGWMKAETVWIFAYINWASINNALGRSQGLGVWFLPIALIAVFGTAIFYVVKMKALTRTKQS